MNAPPQPDADLVQASLSGDVEAFAALYDRHFPAVHDFLARLLRDRAEAADVGQDTFIRAWQRLPQLEHPERFRSWVFSIAHRLGLNRIKRRSRDLSVEPAAFEREELITIDVDRLDDPSRAAEAQETAELMWDIAAGLDPRSYAVLDLHVRQGLESAEIADVLGVTKSNAYTLVSRVKQRLADSVSVYLLARRGREACPDLDALLSDVDIPPVTPEVRRMVDAHVEHCETCQNTRRRLLVPTSVLGALSTVPATPAILAAGRSAVLEGITAETAATSAGAADASEGQAAAASGGWQGVVNAVTSRAALLIGIAAAGALIVGGWLAFRDSNGATEPTVLGVQITATTDSAGARAAADTTTTTSTDPAATAGTTTTAPTSTTATTSTTTPTSTTAAGSQTTTSSAATTTTTPSVTATTAAPSGSTTQPTTTSPVATSTTTTTPPPPPVDPSDVSSPSHVTGQVSANGMVTVAWTPVAGASAYAVLWSQGGPQLPSLTPSATDPMQYLLAGGAGSTTSPPLGNGQWWFNLRTRGPGGEWTSTVDLGPFVIAKPGPATDPSDVTSPSHTVGTPSPTSVVTATWTPVPAAQAYAVLWSRGAPKVPSTNPPTGDPLQAVLGGEVGRTNSPPLANGEWWFNLRTRGPNGDWTSTVHLGPFVIASPAPASDPTDLASPSHVVGVTSAKPVVTVTWTPVTGAAAYSVLWSPGGPALPNTAPVTGDPLQALIAGSLGRADSPPLANGEWWFNLRTRGAGGDWTSTVHLGPFVIDDTPPLPPHFAQVVLDPGSLWELSPDGTPCSIGPSSSTITATVDDPNGDVVEVSLRVLLDGKVLDEFLMDFDAETGLATVVLSFEAGSVPGKAVVDLEFTAKDAQWLMAHSVEDLGPISITVQSCGENESPGGRPG